MHNYKYEVVSWGKCCGVDGKDYYKYIPKYCGSSLVKAIFILLKEKRNADAAITFLWHK